MGRDEKVALKLLYFAVGSLLGSTACGKELLHEESACYRDLLRIGCGEQSFIAVHEAFFTTRVPEGASCGADALVEHLPPPPPSLENALPELSDDDDCYEDVRVAINSRCSGAPNCTYSYKEQADKKCAHYRGQFVVRYDCVKNSSVVKFCNTKLQRREGYFSSPGYPQFYPTLKKCGWTVSASEGQTILLKVLHLQLRPATEGPVPALLPDSLYSLRILGQLVSEVERRCERDALTILERGAVRATLCGGGADALRHFRVECGQAEIHFRSAAFNPTSGFLIYYKVLGCPQAVVPGVRLLEGNGSLSVFACERGVFNDTLEPERTLACVRDHHWNDTLAPCTVLEDHPGITLEPGQQDPEPREANATRATAGRTTTVEDEGPALIQDIIIPIMIIAVLLIGNAIIIAIILTIRKKHAAKLAEEDRVLEIEEDKEEGEATEQPRRAPLIADIDDL